MAPVSYEQPIYNDTYWERNGRMMRNDAPCVPNVYLMCPGDDDE